MRANVPLKAFISLLTLTAFILPCLLCGCHFHFLEKVDRLEPTCAEFGTAEHWRCLLCGQTFADEGGQTPLDDVLISPLSHRYSQHCYDEEFHDKICVVCGYENVNEMQPHRIYYGADENGHYKYCALCDYSTEPAAHVMEDDGLPCADCGYGGLTYELSEDESYYICAGASDAYKKVVTEITIPDDFDGLPVRIIADYAFRDCEALKSVSFGKNIIVLGERVFLNCPKLTEISLNEGLQEIDARAFCDCKGLEQLKLPSSLITLGNAVFSDCTALKSVELPESITTVPFQTFYKCTALSQVTLGNDVKVIEQAAFCEAGITELIIPDGVEEIPMTMCLDCKNLQTVTIPSSVKSIGGGAFSGCSNLQKIIYLGSQEQWEKIELSTYPQVWNYKAENYEVVFTG